MLNFISTLLFAIPLIITPATISSANVEFVEGRGAVINLDFDNPNQDDIVALKYQPINQSTGEIGPVITLTPDNVDPLYDVICNGKDSCSFVLNNQVINEVTNNTTTNNFYAIDYTYNFIFNVVFNNTVNNYYTTNNYYNITNNYIEVVYNSTTNNYEITNTTTINNITNNTQDNTPIWVLVGLLSFLSLITIVFWTIRLGAKD